MKFSIFSSVLCVGVLWAQSVNTESEERLAAIARLGELNGVALQCRYFDQTQRIKQTLVANLPKRRELGLLFENTTNQSFLSFMKRDDTCPGSVVFVRQVDTAVSDLEAAFGR
jgi:hypothetical protein